MKKMFMITVLLLAVGLAKPMDMEEGREQLSYPSHVQMMQVKEKIRRSERGVRALTKKEFLLWQEAHRKKTALQRQEAAMTARRVLEASHKKGAGLLKKAEKHERALLVQLLRRQTAARQLLALVDGDQERALDIIEAFALPTDIAIQLKDAVR